jgi:hypothetical protein
VHAIGLRGTLVSVRVAGSRETAPRKAMATSAAEDTPVAPAVQEETRRDHTAVAREHCALVALRRRVAPAGAQDGSGARDAPSPQQRRHAEHIRGYQILAILGITARKNG